MTRRKFMAQFFQIDSATIDKSGKDDYLFNLFCAEADRIRNGEGSTLVPTASGYKSELRDLTILNGVVKGCVGLLRPDAPSIREVQGTERPVNANPGEHFLEKNYFLYFKDRRVLVWQFNLVANHVNNLGILLTAITGNKHTILCHVLLDDAFAFAGNTEIQLVDFRVRAPRTLAQNSDVKRLDPTEWAIDPFQTMSETEASSIALVLSTGRKNTTLTKIKKMVQGLMDSSQTRRLRVKMVDAEEPIDLLASRVKRRISVKMNGRYADPISAWEELQAAKDDANEEINRCT